MPELSLPLPEMIHQVPCQMRAVAFTFDDGPDPVYTPELLTIFEQAGGHATFFMLGQQIERFPDVARQVHAAGHELGNHTHSHPFLTRLSSAEQLQQLQQTDVLLREVTGNPCRTFRPPYLDANEGVLQVAEQCGYHSIGAVNLDTRDWASPGVEHLVESTLRAVRPGSILLFHDGGGDRSQTVEAVKQLVSLLTAQGYALLTVSGLLQMA
ncbi:polysaccharide deacetylase family protein [Deinococcus roseus]|uniref:Polysaccharide deacetylase family sporulation protein PdaB n=1 Tax=Deinococcus roseus TaxID=392414 RepID=A0ABQ2CZQ4_9DEIO|nr:polysaccharide deacetylase family protein [Deinococcus roseus]GGJ36483.1 polysaccharide deacetylase family sporulation protein PdaB [Deinococcus roseus]